MVACYISTIVDTLKEAYYEFEYVTWQKPVFCMDPTPNATIYIGRVIHQTARRSCNIYCCYQQQW